MSETLRVYTRYPYRGGKKRNSLWGKFLWFVLVIFVFVLSWALWISMDSHQVEEFLPPSPNFQIFTSDIIQNWDMLSNSPVWRLVEGDPNFENIRKFLSGEQGVPVWVTKHLICDFLYISAEDLAEPKTYLVIIKLSRLGSVIEYLYSMFGDVKYDWAGGIGIIYSNSLNIYHTRKGRVVILSPNRRNVVEAVTNPTPVKPGILGKLEEKTGHRGITFYGRLSSPSSMFGIGISGVDFSLVLNTTDILLNADVSMNYNIEDPWSALLSELTPGPIIDDPSEGLVYLGCYTNVPVMNWIKALEGPFVPIELPGNAEKTYLELPDLAKRVFGMFENGFFIKLDSFYFDEIIPFIPRMAIGGNLSQSEWEKASGQIFTIPVRFLGELQKFREGKSPREYTLSLIGSSQTDLIFFPDEGRLVISNSPQMVEWAHKTINSEIHKVEGNLLFKINPERLSEDIEKVIKPLLDSNIIKIKDEKNFESVMSKLKLIKSVSLKISFNKTSSKINGQILFKDLS